MADPSSTQSAYVFETLAAAAGALIVGSVIALVAVLLLACPAQAAEPRIITEWPGCPTCPSHTGWLIGAGVLGLFAGANIGLVALGLFASGGRDD